MSVQRAKDRVYEKLKELLRLHDSVETTTLAETLGLSRSVTSHYLGELEKGGRVIKSDGRPVRWRLTGVGAPSHEPAALHGLNAVIGATGSQRESIRKCIAAVEYPGGLNLLITGSSGVGKTFLAKKVYEYARDTGAIAADAPYKVLNCADYANNPELLSSILFGYTKGAFTGAEANKPGLIQEADGGYLLLDEVHRLSGENQEKLFTFMDTGIYRPIGENQRDWHATVRFIFATTEDPNAALLETFNRRVPVMVHLTTYAHRPVDERLAYIRVLLQTEAKNFHKRLALAPQAVSYLLNLRPAGNVGRLKNLIKLACAKANTGEHPDDLLKVGLTDFDLAGAAFDPVGQLKVAKPMLVAPDTAGEALPPALDLTVGQQLTAYLQSATALTMTDVRRKLQALFTAQGAIDPSISLLHSIHAEVFKHTVVQRFGLKAASDYEDLLFRLYDSRVTLAQPPLEKLQTLAANHPRALHVAQKFYQQLPPLDAASAEALPLLMASVICDSIDESIALRCLMVAHGSRMATSIQSVVNQLCGTYLVDAIDMPIDSSIGQIAMIAKQTVKDFDTSNGFILLVDMGSLSQLYRVIKNQLQGDVLVVNNLTTATALDVALKIQQKLPFDRIAEYASTEYAISTQYFEGFAKNQNIVISCMSGLGISEKLKEIFQSVMDRRLSVVAMDYAHLHQSIEADNISEFDATQLVITTTNLPDSFAIPHINIYDLLDPSGQEFLHNILRQFIDQKTFDDLYNRIVRFLSIEGVTERLSFLNPDVIIQEVETVIFKFENYYHVQLDGKVKLNLYMHISLMVERLMTGVSRNGEKNERTPASQEEADFNTVAKGIFKPLELKYNIDINGYELSLLYQLMNYAFTEAK